MKGKLITIITLLAFLIPGTAVLASDITGAGYQGKISVSNNGTVQTSAFATFSLNTETLIEGDFLADNASDCAIIASSGSDAAFMPSTNSTNPWIFMVPSIGQNEGKNYYLYTSNVTGGKIRYFPGDAGMTTSDNDSSLELGDNFTIKLSGFVSTGNLRSKDDAFYIAYDGDNITADISSHLDPTSANGTDWNNPTFAYNNNTANYADFDCNPSSWSNFIQLSITANNIRAIRYYASGQDANINEIDVDAYYSGDWQDVYQGGFTQSTWEEKSIGGTYSVNATRIRLYNNYGSGIKEARLHDVDFENGVSLVAEDVTSDDHEILVRANVGDETWFSPTGYEDPDTKWTYQPTAAYDDNITSYTTTEISTSSWSSFLNLTITSTPCNVIRFYADREAGFIQTIDLDAYYDSAWHDVYQGDYTDEIWVEKTIGSVEDVTSARVRFYNSLALLPFFATLYEVDFGRQDTITLFVDDVVMDSADFTDKSVPDNSNDFVTGAGGSMPYIEYQEITIGGMQREYVDWEYSDTTFSDSSGYGNAATPSFRTTSSDNISCTLDTFTGYLAGDTPTLPGAATYTLIGDVPEEPGGDMYAELNMNFFGAGVVQTFAEDTEIPLFLVVFIYAFGLAIIFGLGAYALTFQATNKTPGSLLVQAVVSLIVMLYFTVAGGGVIPPWVLLPFGLEALAIIMMSQSPYPWG